MRHRFFRAAALRARPANIFTWPPVCASPPAGGRVTVALLSAAIAAAGLLVGGGARAEASLFIYPTLVMFERHRTSAEVTISNRGDEAGTFEIDWANMSMTPAGGLIRHEDDVAWSVQPFLRYSPRRVTLAPAESQVVKIALRRDPAVPEGEYYAHMRVATIFSEAAGNDGGEAIPATERAGEPRVDAGVSITARPAIAIPVIWRNSAATPAATIESAAPDASGNAVVLDVTRAGLLSARGYVHLIAGRDSGEPFALAEPLPLILYPNVDGRTVSVPLIAPFAVDRLPADAVAVFARDDELTEQSEIYSVRQITPSP